ncbi:MAG TPA: XRE family transcriptional regulator [Candidatus Acetothermia bacterium]|nr:XRE family transcriptional regulator [Candidatus Acetothermia bacterium]
MRVRAIKDIVSTGGMRIAAAGVVGKVAENRTPSRPSHYGYVPVFWEERRRAYWVPPSDIQVVGRGAVDKFITPPPTSEEPVPIPTGGGAAYNFGKNLATVRGARHMSQEALASAMRENGATRVSQATLSKWESRSDSPSGKFIHVAAKVLQVPAFMFFLDMDNLEICGVFLYEFRKLHTQHERRIGADDGKSSVGGTTSAVGGKQTTKV